MRYKAVLLPSLLATFFSLTQSVQAFTIQQPANTGPRITGSPDAVVGNVINSAIILLFTISTIAVTIFVLWGAFEWITSGGDKEKLNGAKKKITTALIGFVVLALAFFIVEVVGVLIGIDPTPQGGWRLPSLIDGTTQQQPAAPARR